MPRPAGLTDPAVAAVAVPRTAVRPVGWRRAGRPVAPSAASVATGRTRADRPRRPADGLRAPGRGGTGRCRRRGRRRRRCASRRRRSTDPGRRGSSPRGRPSSPSTRSRRCPRSRPSARPCPWCRQCRSSARSTWSRSISSPAASSSTRSTSGSIVVAEVVLAVVGLAVAVDLADAPGGLDEERVGAGAVEHERRVATDRCRRQVGDGVVVPLVGEPPQRQRADDAHDQRQHTEQSCPSFPHHTPSRAATCSIRSSGCTTATRT